MSRALMLLAALLSARAATAQVDADRLSGLRARSIGPAGMSGRVADIEAVGVRPGHRLRGLGHRGVWRSRNGGLTWDPLFDDQPVHAVGAVAVFQPNPDIVWVGTGEGNPRNSVSVGNGIYRSLDARAHLEAPGPREDRAHPPRAPPPANPMSPTCARWARSGARTPTAASSRPTDGGRPGRSSSTSTRRRAARTWSWIPGTPRSSSRPCGSSGAGPGSSSPADRGPVSTSPTTAGPPGSGSGGRRVAQGRAGTDRCRHLPQSPRSSTRSWRRRKTRSCARTTGARAGRSRTSAPTCRRGPSTTTTSAWTRSGPTASIAWPRALGLERRGQDLETLAGAGRRRSTWTTTRCGSIRGTAAASTSATTGAWR